VLVIDDNPDGQHYARLVLERAGFTVTTGSSVRDAIALSEGAAVDVIVMDISLPDGSGIDAVRAIRRRELDRGVVATPIVALSAHAMRHHRDDAIAAGVADYVTKPVKPDALVAVVSRHARASIDSDRDVDAEVEVEADIADLVEGFLARIRQRAAAVAPRSGAGDHTELRRLGHDLKGTGAMYGFSRLSSIGADLEAAVLAENHQATQALHAELVMWLSRVRWRVRREDQAEPLP
jgi:CheY-like chemotaxis protein/HPt (histidine-containing phosphotransfer) domain-containing protein